VISPVMGLGRAKPPDIPDINPRPMPVIGPLGPACHVGVTVKARKLTETATVSAHYGSSSSVKSSTPCSCHASTPQSPLTNSELFQRMLSLFGSAPMALPPSCLQELCGRDASSTQTTSTSTSITNS